MISIRYVIAILILVLSISTKASEPKPKLFLAEKYTHLHHLGKQIESLLSLSDDPSIFRNFMLQNSSNIKRGYLGPDRTFNALSVIRDTESFIQEIGPLDLREYSVDDRRETYYILVGASYALKASNMSYENSGIINLTKLRLYNLNCFIFSADISHQMTDSFLPFLWMNECLQSDPGNLGLTLTMLNFLSLVATDQSTLKYASYAIAADIGYQTLTNPNPHTPFSPFNFDEKTSDLKQVAYKTIFFARETNQPRLEYEVLKMTAHLMEQSFSPDESREYISNRMKEIALKNGNLSALQILRLHFESYLVIILGVFCIGYPICVFAISIVRDAPYLKLSRREKYFYTLRNALKKSFAVLTGENLTNPAAKLCQTGWLLTSGILISLLITSSQFDLSNVVIK